MEFDMNLEKLAYIIGRGFLGDFGISSVAYGLLFLSLSFSKEPSFILANCNLPLKTALNE